MKNEALSTDALEALTEVSRGLRSRRLSPRVFKHIKQLTGLKYTQYNRNGIPEITEKGVQALFLKCCIDTLRLLQRNPQAGVDLRARDFLLRKGHLEALPEGGYAVTTKGAESLVDIDQQS
ncbi:hypothetical protein [Chitinilyticum piscinae]|uniref:Uncharacterized protein n=1 Tax=Chitinilyticum piscinae TaxID=2866724 RepID=A0A8J7FN98_9NEIS|nr:hypothetical protein [Chitinilyticum piscinae]MBE9609269.1 hypothetical protein [Chitinilyticum piscinae]